ncbi:hypothetical protein BGAL_0384g00160 [Botrytis galanthina]|uniref:Uncharacterized protein n=1 Tax=Botrytis galanthina TaxID=278940 RepID=A0A4S8QP61_9HELO|nr:hypothetical protein BGAL_0384g00160 [Botrytis galanthina]
MEEMSQTRLMRVHLAPADADPIRRALHRWLRKFCHANVDFLNLESLERSPMTFSQKCQNRITIADIMERFLFTCVAGEVAYDVVDDFAVHYRFCDCAFFGGAGVESGGYGDGGGLCCVSVGLYVYFVDVCK